MLWNNGKTEINALLFFIFFLFFFAFFSRVEELPKQKQQRLRVQIWLSLKHASDLTSLNNDPPYKESANCSPRVHLNFLQLQKKEKQEIPLRMPAGLVCVAGSSERFQMASALLLNISFELILISPALCLPTEGYTGGRINCTVGHKWIAFGLCVQEGGCVVQLMQLQLHSMIYDAETTV